MTEAEKELDHEQAVSMAIKAAETMMQAFNMASDNNQRTQLKRKWNDILSRAEEIKAASTWPPVQDKSLSFLTTLTIRSTPTARIPPVESILESRNEPESSRELTQSEQILLLKNSKLRSFKFPPWTSAPEPKHFHRSEGEFGEAGQYIDSPDLQLSAEQRKSFSEWKHAVNALPPPTLLADARPATMQSDRPLDLVQDVATDCSVVASLCAVVAREEKGHDKLLYKRIYPHDDTQEAPVFSDSGKYIIRLNFNGCYRYVTIDDRLPVSKTHRMLHTLDRNNPSLIWPALLEKAYLKARGGYDFPGSNPGTDLWMILGWIPEQVLLQDEDTEVQELWEAARNCFQRGCVLITAGTGAMTRRTERGLGLASKHAYAVLEVKEENNQTLLLLKNPWSDGCTLGKAVQQCKKDNDPANGGSVGLEDDSNGDKPLSSWDDIKSRAPLYSSPEVQLRQKSSKPKSFFWMSKAEVLQHFESLYLNWDPRLFTNRQDIHFSWTYGISNASADSIADNPQFAVQCSSGELWLLLCRHFKSRDNSQSQGESEPSNGDSNKSTLANGFISLDVYDNNGEMVQSSSHAMKQGQYVDSPQTLLKLNNIQNKPYTVVVRGKDLQYDDHSFTLSLFATSKLSLKRIAAGYQFTTTIKSAWNAATAGGNSDSSNYFMNPQFRLSTSSKTALTLTLEGPNLSTNVNLKLVHSDGKRIFKLARQDVITDSGEYRVGSASAHLKELDPGNYTIICSTFQSGQEGNFSLRVNSTAKVELAQLPSQLAGRFLFDKLSHAIFYPNMEKVAAPILPKKLVKVTAIAKLILPSSDQPPSQPSIRVLGSSSTKSRSPLRLSIELGRGPNKKTLTTSGDAEYEDSSNGIRTPDIDLWPDLRRHGDLWLVLDRLSAPAGGELERFKVELLTDGELGKDIEVGAWRQWDD